MSEQPVETANPPSSPTPKSEQDHVIHTPTLKQNGVKDEEEDIFSPLRESMLYGCCLIIILWDLQIRVQVQD